MLNHLPIHEVYACHFIFQTESSIPMTVWTVAFLVSTVYTKKLLQSSQKYNRTRLIQHLWNQLNYVVICYFFILIWPISSVFALSNIWHLTILVQNFSTLHIEKDRFHFMPQKVIQIWLHSPYRGFLSYHNRFLPQQGGADPGQWDVLHLLPEDWHTLHGGSPVPRQTRQDVSQIVE